MSRVLLTTSGAAKWLTYLGIGLFIVEIRYARRLVRDWRAS